MGLQVQNFGKSVRGGRVPPADHPGKRMLTPDIPHNEVERLRALYEYDILDTPVDSLFDGVAELAATLCGTPFAAVTLIDKDRQWFKAEHGMGVGQSDITRDHSLCAHAILQEEYFEVPDLSLDERFVGNPALGGEVKIRFYGGSQLTTDSGATLGMLCVMDLQPRLLSPAQQRALSQLSNMVMALLATSKRNRQLHDSRALLDRRSSELVSANLFLDSMIEHIPAAVYIKDATLLRYVRVNRAAEEMMGMSREQVIGKGAAELFGQHQANILEEQDRQVAVN
ncbi:MAG: PAS domain-containing protein, partial [Rubrivivax sp.]|nr:PAS domain-containing protein [Rubrivivax sp.]